MREEVWAIVRAAVEEAVTPLVQKQKELEARAERAERFAEAAKSAGKPVGAGIPATTTIVGVPPPTITTTTAQPSIPVTAISLAPDAATSDAPPPVKIPARSLPPTDSYGVTVMPSTRPQLDLEAVGPVDISAFDGGRRRKMVGRAVVVILLLIVVAVVTSTLLSHST